MWNELSSGVESTPLEIEGLATCPIPAVVESVEKGSIGEELGFQAGDQLLTINGVRPRDLIDYRYLIVEEELQLEVIDAEGKIHIVDLEKDLDDGLGLVFTEALFDGLKQCNNHCPFCFIDQQPPGKRSTLYLKDDDFRLSFLYGSYLTLTNLKQSDWQRIKAQRLSPLYVSVHATEPSLRAKLLKNPRAGLIVDQLNWFSRNGLQIHAQVVVCPGLNDGKALEKTLVDLAEFAKADWPAVLSVAVVPVGLTRFRPEEDGLVPVDQASAKKVISIVEHFQRHFFSLLGTRFAWLADEWYLIAKKTLPQRPSYEDLPQQENGVGTIRAFLEAMNHATIDLPKRLTCPRDCSWVVGNLVVEALRPASFRFNSIEGLTFRLYGLSSPYWGQDQVVTGLLTGHDLIDGLRDKNLGEELLLPSMMLHPEKALFLDDMTVDAVGLALNVPIRIVNGVADIVTAAIGVSEGTH